MARHCGKATGNMILSYLQESTGESREDYQCLLIDYITSQLQSDKGTGFGFGNTH